MKDEFIDIDGGHMRWACDINIFVSGVSHSEGNSIFLDGYFSWFFFFFF